MKATIFKVLARLLGLSRQYVSFLMPVLQDSAARMLASLAPIALDVVKSLAESPHSGEQKREAAFRQVQGLAMAEGIRAGSAAINTAIELAVLHLKK